MIKPQTGVDALRRLLPWIVLTICLGVTAFLTVSLAVWNIEGSRSAFEPLTDQILMEIESPIRECAPLLHSASVMVASNSWPFATRQVRVLAEEVLLRSHGDGIVMVGIVEKSPPERGRTTVARHVPPAVERWPVIGLSYLDPRFGTIHGVDLGTDAELRQTMQNACDSGLMTGLTRGMRFRGASTNVPVVFLFQPIYRGGKTPAMFTTRRQESRGVVFLAFVPQERLDKTLDWRIRSRVRVQVFDNPERIDSHRICSLGAEAGTPRNFPLELVRSVSVGGCQWFVAVQMSLESDSNRGLQIGIPIIGLLLSLALFWGARKLGDVFLQYSPRVENVFVRKPDAIPCGNLSLCCDMVLHASSDGVLTMDSQQGIHHSNRVITAMFGYTEAELSGQPLTLLFPEADLQRELHEVFKSTAEVVTDGFSVIGKHKSGHSVPLELVIGSMTCGDKRMFMIFVRDISLRQRTLDSLAHIQKTQIIGSLTSGFAHDLNNVFTAIISHLELAMASGEEQTPRESLEFARTSAKRGAELVARLLLFSRHRPPENQLVNVSEAVNQTTALLRRSITRRIELISKIDPAAWMVRGDEELIRQVLVILCLNARDAMVQGGRITVELINVTLNDAVVEPRRPGHFVCLTVIDNGCGMTSEVRQRLFEPFFTTKGPDKGAGLGLWSARRIVAMHNGWMEVESDPGQGSRVYVFLPKTDQVPGANASSPATPMLERPKTSNEGHEMILVADDDAMVRNLVRAVLGYRGYRVVEAADGVEAVARCEAEPVELVFLDLEMPRMDGWQALTQMHKIKPSLPIILCTGTGLTDEISLRAKNGGATRILEKPFVNSDLLRIVREVLDGNSTPSSEK